MNEQKPAFDPAAAVSRGKRSQPLRVLLYGPPGIGKTQWPSKGPTPIYICAEDGSNHLDVARIHPPDWPAMLATVRWLATAPERYGTVVLDTLDWLEPMMLAYVCERDNGSPDPTSRRSRKTMVDGKPSPAGYPYGGVGAVALEEWRTLLAALDALRRASGAHIVLLAHVGRQRFDNQEGRDDYDVITPKIHKLATALMVEWCDAVLYADWERYTLRVAEGDGKAKMATTGKRVVHTTTEGAHIGKGRELPRKLPLDWGAFYDVARLAFTDDPGEMRSGIEREVAGLGDDVRPKALEWMKEAGDDIGKLRRLHTRVAELLQSRAS